MSDVINWLETQSPENLESDIPKLPVRFAEENKLSSEQQKLLNEMIKEFYRYYDNKINFQQLKAFYHILANPDHKILLSDEGMRKSWFLFEQNATIKEIVKTVLGLVRNRNNIKTAKENLPKYKTIIKKRIEKQEDKNKFSVDVKELNKIRMSFAKHEKTKHSVRGKKQLLTDKGRIIRFTQERSGNIAIIPTIFNAINNGDYSLKEREFNIQTKDFLYPKYEENVIYNIMLVLDTSKSISWVIPHIEKFISYITSNVSNSRDKLGLITFHNDLAKIYHYPTLNVKQVIGTINEIGSKGRSPLGEGLNLALQVFSKAQYRLPGMKNLIILISDCFPEPLEGGHKDLLDEPSYKLVLSASEKIRNEKIGLIIIYPAKKNEDNINWGIKLIKKIVEITDAKHVEIHPEVKYNLFRGEKTFIDEQKLTEFYKVLNDVKLNL